MDARSPRLCVGLLVLAASACSYDPPPEVALEAAPEGGKRFVEDPLVLAFSEPVDAASVRFRVWRGPRETEFPEGEPPSGPPLLDGCALDQATCGDVTIEVGEGARAAVLAFDSAEGALGSAGQTLVLEVLPGIADALGNTTGVSHFFDFQFNARPVAAATPIPFRDGVYVIVGNIDEPLPTVLTAITHIAVLDDNTVALAGAEGDELGDAPKDTVHARELFVDNSDLGWALFMTGTLSEVDGNRLLETVPTDIHLPLGPLTAILRDVRLEANIETVDGQDQLEGLLFFSAVELITAQQTTLYEGGTTSFVGVWAPPEEMPEGVPQLCGDLCGAVLPKGSCEPPTPFPPDGFCEALAAEEAAAAASP